MFDGVSNKEMVIVEDEIKQAEQYYRYLNLMDEIPYVKYAKNLDELKKILSTDGAKRFYLVDINLGRGRNKEGIKVIRTIRDTDPDALIIVYTAYPSEEHNCLEAGADLFFEKDSDTLENDLLQIRNTIIRTLDGKGKAWDSITNIYSQIVDIDDEHNQVRLNCKYKIDSTETFERVFSLNHFKHKDRLSVDDPIFVQILERPGEVRFLFKEGGKNYFEEDEEDVAVSDLKSSPIFGANKKLEL
jgi:ActR/RegA family two-component response regulator